MVLIKDAFPHDDPVARFIVSMSMASNDLLHGAKLVVEASEGEYPDAGYRLRVVNGHFFEACRALSAWRRVPEVKSYLDSCSAETKEHLRVVAGSEQRIGKGVLEHCRTHTFHYPSPDPTYADRNSDAALAEVLELIAEEDLTAAESGDGLGIRFEYADHASLMLALFKYDEDLEQMRVQFEQVREGALAFTLFADHLIAEYLTDRDLYLEMYEPDLAS